LSIRRDDRVARDHFLIVSALVRCVTQDSLDRAHDFRPATGAVLIVTVDVDSRTVKFRHVTVKVCTVRVLICSVTLLVCSVSVLVCSARDKSCQSRVDVRRFRDDSQDQKPEDCQYRIRNGSGTVPEPFHMCAADAVA
jgi:hypothetical protein